AGFGDDGVGSDLGAEDGAGELEHGVGGGGTVSEGGGGCDRGDVHAAGGGGLEDHVEASQEHADVGSLGAVVGVELIEHQVAQGRAGGFPERPVGAAKQQLVEHLVVGEHDVRDAAADHLPVGDEAVLGDDCRRAVGGLPRVEGGRDALVGGVLGDRLRKTP